MDYAKVMRKELIPAFGCTEPIALAFTSAKASELLGGVKKIDKLIARCSGNIIKNTKSVLVPGTDGNKGIEISCVLGAIGGDPKKDLEVLSGVDKSLIPVAKEMIKNGVCKVELVPGVANLYIEIEINSDGHSAIATVKDEHTNIIKLVKDGEVVFENTEDAGAKEEELPYSFDGIYEYAKTCDYSDVKDIIETQIKYNMEIAEEGIKNSYGSNIGSTILDSYDDLEHKMMAYAAAGSDARMSGSEMPVVINSGSGNQGITVSVPIIVYAREKGVSEDELYRTLIFANMIGLYLKQGIGRLSAYCGAVSAGCATVAGISFMNKDPKEITELTLQNALAGISGTICDGAKSSCAMKISAAIQNALLAYKQAKSGNSFHAGDGIVKGSIDETIKAVGHIAKYGMKETDIVILNEMIEDYSYLEEK